MQFKPFEPGIEVFGASIDAIVDAFKLFPSIALKRLVNAGIGTMRGKDVVVNRDSWYPPRRTGSRCSRASPARLGPARRAEIGGTFRSTRRSRPPSTTSRASMASMGRVPHEPPQGREGHVRPGHRADPSGIGNYGYAPVRARAPDHLRLREPVPVRLRPRDHHHSGQTGSRRRRGSPTTTARRAARTAPTAASSSSPGNAATSRRIELIPVLSRDSVGPVLKLHGWHSSATTFRVRIAIALKG